MTALEETKIRIKVYEELIESIAEIFEGRSVAPTAGINQLLEGLVKMEKKIIEEFKLEEK